MFGSWFVSRFCIDVCLDLFGVGLGFFGLCFVVLGCVFDLLGRDAWGLLAGVGSLYMCVFLLFGVGGLGCIFLVCLFIVVIALVLCGVWFLKCSVLLLWGCIFGCFVCLIILWLGVFSVFVLGVGWVCLFDRVRICSFGLVVIRIVILISVLVLSVRCSFVFGWCWVVF